MTYNNHPAIVEIEDIEGINQLTLEHRPTGQTNEDGTEATRPVLVVELALRDRPYANQVDSLFLSAATVQRWDRPDLHPVEPPAIPEESTPTTEEAGEPSAPETPSTAEEAPVVSPVDTPPASTIATGESTNGKSNGNGKGKASASSTPPPASGTPTEG